ncbi:MAG: transcription-repair coupling factor [Myxococcota bacterium]
MAWLADVPRLGDTPLGGLAPGAIAYALAAVPRAWIVVPTRDDAERLVRALRYHGADARPYPADDGRPWDGLSPDPAIPRQRLAVRDAWARGEPFLAVVPAKTLALAVPKRVETLEVVAGVEHDRAALVAWLVAHGYLSTQKVEEPGCFAARGGVVDVWPGEHERPLRIEWFDEDVETIREVGGEKRKRARLLPAREAALTSETAERAAAYIHAVATERGVVGNERRRILSDLRNGIWFPGAEDYLPALADVGPVAVGRPLYVVEPDLVRAELARFAEQARARFDALEPEDRPLVRPSDRYVDVPELDGVPVTALGDTFDTRDNKDLRVGAGEVAPVAKRLARLAEEGRPVTVVADGSHDAERVRALFMPLRFDDGKARPGRLALDVGDLPAGFRSEEAVFVTTAELFGERKAAPAATPSFRKAALASFSGLRLGDLVVHARHGIGRYQGLARMPLGEHAGDFVQVVYRDGEKLYVPVHRLDLVTPWRAVGEGEQPRLDRLGGQTWEARRAKVRDAVLQLAHELLRLYARRKIATARPYPKGSLEDQFAATFPYVETPDQEAAIDEVLADLERDEPMERLLVGDVGFGKTEVALRAAFRVVEGGGQVVVLCPTTVLAVQHHETFRRRFEGFPVRVEALSRFQSAADVRRIEADLQKGLVDVVVGTTKLLGRGVKLRELGLVVVDEEHRFGVKQKEQLKKLAAGAHYLAMTATPIPRTLQMALAGIRSLSILATPPEGRHAIRTEVVRFARDRVREDVLHELRRGGQVFFVHNRVQSIGGVARWLADAVPEATIGVAHGQMEDEALEAALVRFIRRETNVLVSTTIIESGIDLPLVNTMIVNRADRLGLAQLYQLRGRIGRGAVRAHCTLLVGGTGEVRREAMRRLRALQEHTELGSGFALASADLELRGGGELLGEKQHGHIAAIGFDAYLELLEEAVARARGEAAHAEVDPEVEVAAPAWLPEELIPDTTERLTAYQELATARSRDEVRRRVDALEARWGPLPPEAVNLGWLVGVRVRCKELGVARLAVLKVRVVCELAPGTRVRPETLDALFQSEPNRFRRLGERELEMRFTPGEGEHPFRLLEYLLARVGEGVVDSRGRRV